jgi:hypothetical protein
VLTPVLQWGMDAFVAVLGTLLGGLLGAAGTYVNQRSARRSESQEKLGTLRREVYLRYMLAVHAMYTQVAEIHRTHRDQAITDEDAVRRLRAVPAQDAQLALEDLRLVSGDHGVAVAAKVWSQMRRSPSPIGENVTWAGFTEWRNEYWTARRDMTDAARADLGYQPLDWSTAGAN